MPDFEPNTESEVEGFGIVGYVFANTPVEGRGAFLDMCFNPRNTRLLTCARRWEWRTVEGINIIGWQVDEQYRLWAGEVKVKEIPHEEVWKALRDAADRSEFIN